MKTHEEQTMDRMVADSCQAAVIFWQGIGSRDPYVWLGALNYMTAKALSRNNSEV